MEKYLREWRQDAVNKHQYDTAIFVADKLLAITGDDQDAFWLAQVHFSTGNYNRTQSLLARGKLSDRNPQCRYLAAHCSIKLGKIEEALQTLGEKNPSHLVSVAGSGSARQKLRHVDTNSRAGARHNKSGARNERLPTSEERDREEVDNIKSEAGMCYLRGVCYAKQNSFDRAKECYKTAVQIDVQCFEAFDALMANSLMSPKEEWTFIESLNFDSITAPGNSSLSQEAAEFTKNLYTTRLSKYAKPEEFANATDTLSTHYRLGSNPDILLSKADLMFTQCRFREALALTSSVLAKDQYNFSILPLHLASLYELSQTNALFLLAHDLADTNPNEPGSWLAVGIYYLSTNRIAEARRYFSKASMMDPHFGPAWIGFAHTFAAEGEHDQAISAYSTAARLFQGTHLPQLFLGMQNLQLSNLSLAREYLSTAYSLCDTDPLLLNEMGVVAFHSTDLSAAIKLFQKALGYSQQNEADPDSIIPTRINLAHALRRDGALEEALRVFEEVLRHGVKDPGVFTAKGLVLLEAGRSWDAVTVLHEALAVAPQDPMATDLLNRALEANETDSAVFMLEAAPSQNGMGLIEDEVDDPVFEEALKRRKNALRDMEPNRVAGRRGRRRRYAAGFVEEESDVGESMVVDSDG
ncbi:TPR-like protein [Macroventuria anomochaeta]|uniref:TPR-like protein n=1 Tax=Macroventuria anomochaeta TaxID=301207 RepID=A0ACB6S0L9_9PLEO|nr:TPR-like protein [Macroventuria anomochaeta]KAF2626739.1 TPR-like protein [Macroventuria anomochaeta]